MGDKPTAAARRRELFPTLERGAYLLSHSLGPVPRGAWDYLKTYLERWQGHASEDAWAAEWWTLSADVGDHIARVIGAPPGTVQVQPNASLAMSAAASCFDFARGPRRRVVTTSLDFPSMAYIWQAQARRGAEVCVVPSDDDVQVPLERIVDAIDEKTALVAISHVSYRSSYRVEVAEIVQRAHAVGAKVLFDVYQSAGVCVLEAERWGVDFMIGGSIKWLCGGPACGYLYVRKELISEFQPTLTGWFAHARPLDFDHGTMEYDASVRRFAQGTPSIPALYSFLAGLEYIDSVGVADIAAESRRRTSAMVAHAQQHGWRLHCPTDADQRGGTVMIEVERPKEKVAALAEREVFVDFRPGVGLRVSPHYFNKDEEIERALVEIGRVVEG